MAFVPIEQCAGCGGSGWITIDHGRIGCPNCNPQPYIQEVAVPGFTTLTKDEPTTVAAATEADGLRFTLGTGVSFLIARPDARALAEWILANTTAAVTPEGT